MIAELKRAVVLAPEDAEARFRLGEALLVDGQADAASTQLEKCLALAPEHANARRVLARAYVAAGRLTAAEKLLLPAAESGDVDACDALADLLERLGRGDDALLFRVAAARLAAADVDRQVKAASGLLALGLVARAREHVEKAAALAPDHRDVLALRRALAASEGDLALATTPALERGPDFLLGRALAELPIEARGLEGVVAALRAGDASAAKRALVLASERGAGFSWLRGEVAAATGDFALAERAFRDVRAERSELVARVQLRLAELAARRGDAEGARRVLAAAPEGTPVDLDRFEALGDACAASGDMRAAEEAYAKAARIDPTSPAGAKAAALRAKRKHAPSKRGATIGVLGWNERGGRVSPVEAVVVPGKGALVFTGNAGTSGREAADVAFGCARARAAELGMASKLSSVDVHVHFSDTEITKDGASSGLALALAILSALSEEPLVPNLACTGEITALGVVRPVAGLHEKLVAACLAGMTLVIVPRKNLLDLRALPAEVRRRTTIRAVDTLAEALEIAFGIPPSTNPG